MASKQEALNERIVQFYKTTNFIFDHSFDENLLKSTVFYRNIRIGEYTLLLSKFSTKE